VIVTGDVSALVPLPRGRHVCWVVTDDATYREGATALLADGRALGEQTIVFGPENSAARQALTTLAAVSADPAIDVLHGGPLEPESMFTMFRDRFAQAGADGHQGLRLIADMDWLLPLQPAAADIVGFELLLDRLVSELGATIVCAYRTATFDTDAITGALCVHPTAVGVEDDPLFQLVAADPRQWRLAGEVDLAVAAPFAAALTTAARDDECVLDVAELGFIDVAGMRTIADAARTSGATMCLRGASASLRRRWELAGFDAYAPNVELVA
jgi:anti-anti-sigma factor